MKLLSSLCGVIVALAIIGTAAGQAAQVKKPGVIFKAPGSHTHDVALTAVDEPAGDAPKENTAKKEMAKLHGTWQLVAAEIFGQGRAFKAPEEEVALEKVIIKGDNWTYRPARGGETKARYQLGATRKLQTIDLAWTEGDDKGKTYPGVFKLEGDTLTICYAREGKERPTGFTAEATKEMKDHCVLMVLQRKKP